MRALPWDLSLQFRNAILLPVIYEDDPEIESFRRRFADGLGRVSRQFPLDRPEAAQRALQAIQSENAFYLSYQGRNDRELLSQYGEFIHRVMAANYPQWTRPVSMPPAAAGERLRIGFVSACFSSHSVAKTHAGWLKCLRDTCDIYGYYVAVATDNVTDQVRGYCHRWRHFPYDFERTCRTIVDDRLHALVYLDIGMHGWTTQLAALRLAPVQANTWGHPVTSGLPTVDYYFSSELMEPPDGGEHYTEELMRLPGLGIYYEEAPRAGGAPRSREDFGLRENALVYLCCQSLYKYLPRHDRILAAIARQVPDAQFAFIAPNALLARKFLHRLEAAFRAEGVDFAGRCVILPKLDSLSFWNVNRLADVFLDTLTWSGCNTTLEAVACGLPVVTCPGEFMRGRHSYAILNLLEANESIAGDEEAYIDLAVRMGTDAAWRKEIAGHITRNRTHLYGDRACITKLENFFHSVAEKS